MLLKHKTPPIFPILKFLVEFMLIFRKISCPFEIKLHRFCRFRAFGWSFHDFSAFQHANYGKNSTKFADFEIFGGVLGAYTEKTPLTQKNALKISAFFVIKSKFPWDCCGSSIHIYKQFPSPRRGLGLLREQLPHLFTLHSSLPVGALGLLREQPPHLFTFHSSLPAGALGLLREQHTISRSAVRIRAARHTAFICTHSGVILEIQLLRL